MPPINPRPIFSKAMAKLEDARCPECGRAFDPVGAAEDYAPRIQPLHCSWCAQRVMLIREYQVWRQQDAAAARAVRQKRLHGQK